MEIILWGMEVLAVDGLPSEGVMKEISECLQKKCGIDTVHYKGPFGHPYYVNHLAAIIAQVCALSKILLCALAGMISSGNGEPSGRAASSFLPRRCWQ